MTDDINALELYKALYTLVSHLDSCRQVERGAGGMTIDSQLRRTELIGVRSIWVEEAREVLNEIRLGLL